MIAQADGGEGAEGAEEKGANAEEAAEAAAGAGEVSRGDTHVEARAAAAAGVLAEVWARGAPRYAPHPEVAECTLTLTLNLP